MTILNVAVLGERVFVGTNTAAWNAQTGAVAHIGKLHVLTHLGAIVASRGAAEVGAIVASASNVGQDFEALADAMPELIAQASRIAGENAQRMGIDLSMPGLGIDSPTVLLVGPSPKLGRAVAYLFNGGERSEVGECYAPWEAAWGPSPSATTREQFCNIARLQVSLARGEEPAAPWGGRFIVAEITMQGMTIESACALQ